MKVFIILWFSILTLSLFSQTTISVGKSSYINEQLVFYAYSDYITFLKDTIAVVQTNEQGGGTTSINTDRTREVFLDLGVYHCSFYIEKDKNYELDLPQKRLKTKAEELNIYFEPLQVRLALGSKNPKDLNKLITSFDDIYDDFLEKKFDTIYKFPHSKVVDIFENNINNFYSEVHNSFFDNYKKYKIANLKYLGPNRSYKTINFKYYNKYPILYCNPSYMFLFNSMFKDFFTLYINTKEGVRLGNVISQGRSIEKLKQLIDKDVSFSDSALEELVALKGIHDELFHPRMYNQFHFPRPQMKIILDSVANFSLNQEHRLIASNIIKKYQEEAKIIGKKSPNFELISIDGTTKTLDDFKGRYIYLNFMRTDIVPAMEEMDRMINFYKNHKDDIEIVSIFTDDDISDFYQLDTNKYQWTLLHIGKDRSLLDFYKQITWPQFYLISPKGKVIASPAPSIKEGFEIKFFNLIDRRN